MIQPSPAIIAAGVVGVLILVAAVNVAITARQALATRDYWQRELGVRPAPNAIRLVALGDSSVQGVGASRPADTYVGRIASYLTQKTGRPVHIENVATGGSITDIVARQIPQVDLKTADVVVIADDNLSGMSLDQYRATLEAIAAKVPTDRTVISDLPGLPGESRYQPVLTQVADSYGIARADVKAIFNQQRRIDVFSWLPPHMNDRGYSYWFEAFKPKIDSIFGRTQEVSVS